MQAFSVNSKYISNLITGLNLTLVTVMLAFMPNRVPTSIFNITTLPSSLTKYYNVSQAIPIFLVIVKPAFIKYLKKIREKLIKRVPWNKYNDFISWLADLNYKTYL
jgi:hypothetical protein